MARFLLQMLMGVAVWGGLHFYLWLRLARDTALSPFASTAVALALGAVAFIGFLALTHRMPAPFDKPVHALGYAWMGAFLPLLTLLGVGDLLQLGLGTFAHADGTSVVSPVTFSRVQALGALGLGGGLTLVGWWRTRRPAPLKKLEVQLERWPEALDGYRIVQVSDLHIDAAMTREAVDGLVDRILERKPDLVALTGDLIDGSPRALAEKVAPLGRLKARHGVWFVTGNHEYYSGGDAWIRMHRSLGIGVLQNERVLIGEGEASYELVGVPDWTGGQFGPQHQPRLRAVLDGRDESKESILLAHQPRQFREAAELGVGLQLSGHTHGGQLWPFTHIVSLVEPFFAGLYRRGRSQLYVSRGTGTWGPPVRTFAPHELTELTLRRG